MQNKFAAEFFIGIFTWLLWILAAFLISHNNYSEACITIAIAIIIASIELHFLSQMEFTLKKSFLKINFLYILLLILSGLSLTISTLLSGLLMYAMLGIVLYDYYKHDSPRTLFNDLI